MFRRLKIGALTGLGLILQVSLANATIMLSNDASFGAGQDGMNLTVDEANNLEWLDWSLTFSRSYNDVSSKLGSGGEFEGFRYASTTDFVDLLISAGVSPAEDSTSPIIDSAFTDLMTALGISESGQFSLAVFDSSFVSGSHAIGGLWLDPTNCTIGLEPGGIEVPDANGPCWRHDYLDSTVSALIGHALVRASSISVPAPTTTALLALGILGYARRRRTH